MLQTLMFDQQGKPTQIAMRYVLPKYYVVKHQHKSGLANISYITKDVHDAIGRWLKNIDAKIITVW
jgi:hypothetical protein